MKRVIKRYLWGFENTRKTFTWDLKRMRARLRTERMFRLYVKKHKLPEKLHFGCGKRAFPGWLNCDVKGTDIDIDLAAGKLPFPSGHFECVCSQHVIEHLKLENELQPLLLEANRCLKDNGEIWLSCPDLEKICNYYVEDKGEGLLRDRQKRYPNNNTKGYPTSHFINMLFTQGGSHKNLFDFELLKSALEKANFEHIKKRQEKDLLEKFPEIPSRNDDYQTLYVSARKSSKHYKL